MTLCLEMSKWVMRSFFNINFIFQLNLLLGFFGAYLIRHQAQSELFF